MSSTIHFELVSPEKKLISESVHIVQIPGDEGEFGVMAGHCALVSSLKAGVVKLRKEEGGAVRSIFIAGGFADVTGQNCTVLAEEAMPVEDLDRKYLEEHLKDLTEDLGLVKEEADLRRVRSKITLVKAKLSAALAA